MRKHKALSLAVLLFSCAVLGGGLWFAGLAMKFQYAPYIALAAVGLVAIPVFSRELIGARVACNIEQVMVNSLAYGAVLSTGSACLVYGVMWILVPESSPSFGRIFLMAAAGFLPVIITAEIAGGRFRHFKYVMIRDSLKGSTRWLVADETEISVVLTRKKDRLTLLKESPSIGEIRTCCGESLSGD